MESQYETVRDISIFVNQRRVHLQFRHPVSGARAETYIQNDSFILVIVFVVCNQVCFYYQYICSLFSVGSQLAAA